VTAGKTLPVVTDDDPQNRWAAQFLVQTIEETTGRRPSLYVELKGQRGKWPAGGLFIGDVAANGGWERPPAESGAAAFRVVATDGAVRFLGRADYAVFDWCERELGMRFYCEDGKCVERRPEIVVPAVDYSDRPVFDCRQLGWRAPVPWLRVARYGSEHRGGVSVHQPARWFTNAAVRAEAPDIFETGLTPMLCYGNPQTLAYYQRRIDRHIAGLEDSDGIVDTNRQVVTVCQWDAPVRCTCRWCRDAYDARAGFRGSASPILWGRFTRRLADWLKAAHPDYMISFLPYLNTCRVPPDLLPGRRTDRHRGARQGRVLRRPEPARLTNAEAELCTMPGVALLKDPDVRRREERLIRDWHRATGAKVLNWHYSCWPRDWTSAPYVYGKTIRRHYADMAGHVSGSYVCGDPQDVRQQLSHYVWMKCLWNPAIDVEALYDEYARRRFGAGAAPMRELVRLQEDCWNRQWDGEECTYGNVSGISFPRKDAERMRALLVEAHRLATAADDATAVRRIVTYASGINDFMLESDALADAVREPTWIRRSVRPGETNRMVAARSVRCPTPWAATTVVTAREGDELVFTVRCAEPAVGQMNLDDEPADDFVWGNDNLEFAFAGGERHKIGAVVAAGPSSAESRRIVARVTHDGAGWTAHVRVKLTADELKAGKLVGNVSRWRVGDRRLPPETRVPGSRYEHSRLNTVYTQPNDDPAAFVEFRLKR